MNKSIVLIITLALFLAACSPIWTDNREQENIPIGINGVVSFTTEDKVQIVGQFWPSESDRAVIFLHQLDGTRGTWGQLPQMMQQRGFNALALDMRGHGDSKKDWPTWRDLNQKKWETYKNDLAAAKEFLVDNGVDPKKIQIVGASIGGNVAVDYAVTDPDIQSLVLLSAGLRYQALPIVTILDQYQGSALLMVGTSDSYAFQSALLIEGGFPNPDTDLLTVSSRAHGIKILADFPETITALIQWLEGH